MIYIAHREYAKSAVSWLVLVAAVLVALLLGISQSVASSGSFPLSADHAFALSVERKVDGSVLLTWDIAHGYYLYRDHFSLKPADGEDIPLKIPPGVAKADPTFGPAEVFYDHVTVRATAVAGELLQLTYQGCMDHGICYPPIRKTITPDGKVVAVVAQRPEPQSGEIWQNAESGMAPASGGDVRLASGPGTDLIGSLLSHGGVPLLVLGFMGFGLLLAFTPCVFPMFPIVLAMLGGQGTRLTVWRSTLLVGSYVLAMASAFALLGVVAAWSGQNLQVALQSPLALGLVAALFVVLALSMFGLFELSMPASIARRLGRVGGEMAGSITGAALLGFTSALIMGPCVTAPLAGALLYIAQTGNVAIGATALFALGLGQGLPLLVLGILGPRALPRAGAWMERTKSVFGFVFMASAVWLMSRLISGPAVLALWAVLLVCAGVLLGGLDTHQDDKGRARHLSRVPGLLALFLGSIMGIGAAAGASDPLHPLAVFRAVESAASPSPLTQDQNFTEATSMAQMKTLVRAATHRPSLVYFTADWCVSCSIIQHRIFADPDGQVALSKLNIIKVDATKATSPLNTFMRQMSVAGPPTMIFFDPLAQEIPGTRLVGEISLQEFLAAAKRAKAAS